MKFLKLLILLTIGATSAHADYLDTLELLEYANSMKERIELLKTADDFADLRLWYLRQSQPKIFVDIETADNATDMGYFRLDFNAAGKFEKLQMLDEFIK